MFIGKAISNFSIPCKWQQSNDTKNCMGNKDFKTIRGPKIYLKTEDMLYSGCNGTGLSFYIKYADESTDEEPVVIAKGVDENGNDFEQRIFINKITQTSHTTSGNKALINAGWDTNQLISCVFTAFVILMASVLTPSIKMLTRLDRAVHSSMSCMSSQHT